MSKMDTVQYTYDGPSIPWINNYDYSLSNRWALQKSGGDNGLFDGQPEYLANIYRQIVDDFLGAESI